MTEQINARIPKTFTEKVHSQESNKAGGHRMKSKEDIERSKTEAAAHGYKTRADGTIIDPDENRGGGGRSWNSQKLHEMMDQHKNTPEEVAKIQKMSQQAGILLPSWFHADTNLPAANLPAAAPANESKTPSAKPNYAVLAGVALVIFFLVR
jgi:hypothetical protein